MIFQVGQEPQIERKLLVSSVQLSQVSSVFAAMFDGRFAEGQDLTPASPRVVPLPEDDADVMAVVCKIVHHLSADISVTTTATELANIVLMCHKYDCVEAIRSWGIIWTADVLQRPTAADFEKTLVATYLLDLAPQFLDTSKSLIRDRSDLLSISAMSLDHEFLPLRLLERIVREQYETQRRALVALGPIVPATDICDAARLKMAEFLQDLRLIGLWPLNTLSLAALRAQFAQMPNRLPHKCTSSYMCACRTWVLDACTMLRLINKVYDDVKGVCLDCVKRKELGVNRPTCRVECSSDANLTYV